VANHTDSLVAITNREGLIEWVNQAFVLVTGYAVKEAIGQPFQGLLSGPDTDRLVAATLTEALRSQTTVCEEILYRRKNGAALRASVRIAPLRNSGSHSDRMVVVQQDITERRASELASQEQIRCLERDLERQAGELLAARNEAEAASEARNRFIAGISHEMRTPLNAIVGFIHLCLQTGLTTQQREYVANTEHAARNLIRIVDDVLDYSAIESGALKLERAAFELHSVMSQVEALVGIAARARGLDLRMDVATDVPAVLQGDSKRIEQVLLNLLGHAVAQTERGAIALQVQRLRADAESVELGFRVGFSGTGHTADQQKRLFQAFSQSDDANARPFSDHHLGLAISARLVQQLGGRFWLEGRPGEDGAIAFTARFGRISGTRTLPVLPGAEPLRSDTLGQLRGRRVLVVEDNAFNQAVIVELLAAVGIRTQVANHGLEALQILESDSQFDIVLMDVMMPGIDGHEATRRIRRHPQLSGLRIAAMTANAGADDRQRCIESGMDDFHAKPVDPASLYAMLLRLLPAAAAQSSPPSAGSVAAPRSPKPDFDPGALRSLFPNSPEYVREMAEKFVHHASAAVPGLRDACAGGNPEVLRDIGHKYKSSAAMIGANRISSIFAELERCGRSGDLSGCELRINELPGLLDQIEQLVAAGTHLA
jgi:PAS domain S-box-containing protein